MNYFGEIKKYKDNMKIND